MFLLVAVAAGAPIRVNVRAQARPLIVLPESALNDRDLYDAWIEFKDKGQPTEEQRGSIVKYLEKNLDPRAVARRKAKRRFPGLFDQRDYPLVREYLEGVAATGARIRVRSRWLNGLTVIAGKSQIENIKALPYVKDVTDLHLRRPRLKAVSRAPDPAAAPPETAPIYGYADAQIRRTHLQKLHAAGFTGRGILIAVIDCGFDLSHEAFHHPQHPLRVVARRDFVENDEDVRPQPEAHVTNYGHGTFVLSTLAAYLPGMLVGTGYDADYILCNAEDGEEEYYLEEKWFVAALEFAEARGADIATSSLVLYGGYQQRQLDGRTSIMTQGMNIAAGNGVICFAGAGNAGHDQDPALSHLMSPGDAADVITVGAVGLNGKVAPFSSDGPTADGRLKPEVLALGEEVATVSLYNKRGISHVSGTSLATPLMAGAAACLLQVHPSWSAGDLRKALFSSGDYFRRASRPDSLFVQGYGVPDVFLASGLK